MKEAFKTWRTNRTHYADALNDFSTEQLNKVPDGFENNLIWNIGHSIVTQQGLIYSLSGLKMNISNELYATYKSGTKPDRPITEAEIKELTLLLESTIPQTEKDFADGIFQTYKYLKTSTRFEINDIESAIHFNNYHEGLHLGYIFSLKKLV